MLSKKNRPGEQKYSYRDCWNYAISLQGDSEIEKVKNDLINLCWTTSEIFWSTFSEECLSLPDYLLICGNLSKYLKENYPVPYLINKVSFYGLSFQVKKGVFIPQKDTEILVEKTLEIADKYWLKKENLKVLDIGTGCGNIVVSLAKNKPKWNFVAIDINQEALAIAKINAEMHQIKNVNFVQSNLFDNVEINEKFNIIISNPPYISEFEYKNLSISAQAQPKEALVAKNNGYFFYQEIFRKVHSFLTEKFLVVVEIGHRQSEEIIKLVIDYFPKTKLSIFFDYQDKSRVLAIYQVV